MAGAVALLGLVHRPPAGAALGQWRPRLRCRKRRCIRRKVDRRQAWRVGAAPPPVVGRGASKVLLAGLQCKAGSMRGGSRRRPRCCTSRVPGREETSCQAPQWPSVEACISTRHHRNRCPVAGLLVLRLVSMLASTWLWARLASQSTHLASEWRFASSAQALLAACCHRTSQSSQLAPGWRSLL